MPGAAKPDPATYAKAYAKLPEESGFTKEGLQTLTLKAGPLDVFRAQLEITALDDKTMKNYKKAALIVKLLQKGPLPTVRATTLARAPCPRPLPPVSCPRPRPAPCSNPPLVASSRRPRRSSGKRPSGATRTSARLGEESSSRGPPRASDRRRIG